MLEREVPFELDLLAILILGIARLTPILKSFSLALAEETKYHQAGFTIHFSYK